MVLEFLKIVSKRELEKLHDLQKEILYIFQHQLPDLNKLIDLQYFDLALNMYLQSL